MKNYDKNKTSIYMYLDLNNLYGYAVSQYLPSGNCKWLSENKLKN